MVRILSVFVMALAMSAVCGWPHSVLAQDEDYADYHILEFLIPEGKVLRRTTTTTKTTTENGKTQTGVYTGVYDLQLEPYEDGFMVTRTRTDYSLNIGMPAAQTPEQRAGLDALADSILPRKIVYYSDVSLAPYQIENWEEFQTQLYNSLVTMSGGKFDRKVFDAVYGVLGPDGNVNLFLKDDALLSVPHNIALPLNNPIQAVSDTEGPLGGIVTVTESLILTQWSPDTDRAVVEYQSMPEPHSLKAYLIQFTQAFSQRAGQSVPDDLDAEVAKMTIDMTTHCRFEVVISSGLVEKGVCEIRSGFSTPENSKIKTETYEMVEEWLP